MVHFWLFTQNGIPSSSLLVPTFQYSAPVFSFLFDDSIIYFSRNPFFKHWVYILKCLLQNCTCSWWTWKAKYLRVVNVKSACLYVCWPMQMVSGCPCRLGVNTWIGVYSAWGYIQGKPTADQPGERKIKSVLLFLMKKQDNKHGPTYAKFSAPYSCWLLFRL